MRRREISIITWEDLVLLCTVMKESEPWLRLPQTADANRMSVSYVFGVERSDTSPDKRDVLKALVLCLSVAAAALAAW